MNAIPDRIARALEESRWHAETGWDHFAGLVESPIETMLLEQIMASQWGVATHLVGLHLLGREFQFGEERFLNAQGIICYPQGRIGDYRADFVFDVDLPFSSRKIYVVECDGHDFHERTKEQAAHDRQRDRFMTARAIAVLRYTGSEIYNDAEFVWHQIVEIITEGRGFNWPNPANRELRIGGGIA